MACFIAPAAEAIVVSAATHHNRKVNKDTHNDLEQQDHITFSSYLVQKLQWLSTLLWGGSFLLLIEHIWHGEIVPWFPFLTALNNPKDIRPMLTEIATVGTTMALTVTFTWFIAVAICYMNARKQADATSITNQEG